MIAVVVLLSLLHHVRFHLECTVYCVVAINILITHAVQRTTHLLAPVHSAVGLSVAMICNAMPDSRFQSNFSNGCVNAVFNYSMTINNLCSCKFM